MEIFSVFFFSMSWDCIWVACSAASRMQWDPGVPVCICHAHTATRHQWRLECGGRWGCFMWQKSNQQLSGLMKSISPFSGCSKMGIQPLQHVLES